MKACRWRSARNQVQVRLQEEHWLYRGYSNPRLRHVDIRKVDMLRWRDSDNAKRIRLLKADMCKFAMPPATGYLYNGRVTLTDGNHRANAARLLGQKKIPVVLWTPPPPTP